MPYYEYEYIVKNLIDILKEKEEGEKGTSNNMHEQMNSQQLMKDAKKSMPSGTTMPKYKSPSMKFPGLPSSLKL